MFPVRKHYAEILLILALHRREFAGRRGWSFKVSAGDRNTPFGE